MRVIEQTPDTFVVELEIEELHWWQKLWLRISDWWHRKHLWLSHRY